jgi:hypothetical protein
MNILSAVLKLLHAHRQIEGNVNFFFQLFILNAPEEAFFERSGVTTGQTERL